MRVLEILILVLDGVYLLGAIRRPRWLNWLPLTAVLLIPVHLVVEGYRWQMLPTFGLTAVLAATAVWHLRQSDQARKLWRGVGLLVGGLVWLVAVALPWLLPVPQPPQPSGPLPIGAITRHLVDASRDEIWTADPGDHREIMVQVWYPTDQTEGETAPYLENLDVIGPALAEQFGLQPFMFNHVNLSKTAAHPDAPVIGEELPIILFSHGLTGFRGQNTGMVQELASHGFVVATVDHTFGNVLTAFPDGRIEFYDPCRIEPSCDVTAQNGGRKLERQWAEDLSFVLDEMAKWTADPNNPFYNRLNLENVGVFGHSTGGGTAVLFCHDDSRCRAALPLDGWVLPVDDEITGLAKPVMFISTPAWLGEENAARGQAMFTHSTGPAYALAIAGTEHYDFSDMPLFSPLTHQLGLSGTIDGERVTSILNQYAVAFFRQYLAGTDEDLLAQTAVFPEVTLQKHE